MQARVVGALQGARWLATGWRLFRAAPLGWLAAVFAYWLLMTVLSLLPFVGIPAAAVLVPAFSVGFMALARAGGRGGALEFGLLFDGFRHQPRAQFGLGIVYLLSLALVLAVTALLDEGALARWMLTGERPATEVLEAQPFFGALGMAMALYLPVMFAFWFAPALAAWHSAGAAKALFFSFFACLVNWRAFLVYGALAALLAFAAALIVRVSPLLFFPVLIVLLPTLFGSFYASYHDVFGARE